jgi:hypothetical protein
MLVKIRFFEPHSEEDDRIVESFLRDRKLITRKTQTMKPGWKTTEFWLSLLAGLVGLAFMLVGEAGPVGQGLSLLATALSALGYTVVRGSLKKAETAAGALKQLPPQ